MNFTCYKDTKYSGWDSQDLESQHLGCGGKRSQGSVWATWDPVLENKTRIKQKAEEDIGMQMLGLYQDLPLDKAEPGVQTYLKGQREWVWSPGKVASSITDLWSVWNAVLKYYFLDSTSYLYCPFCILCPWCLWLMFSLEGMTSKKNLEKSFLFLLWKLAIACVLDALCSNFFIYKMRN